METLLFAVLTILVVGLVVAVANRRAEEAAELVGSFTFVSAVDAVDVDVEVKTSAKGLMAAAVVAESIPTAPMSQRVETGVVKARPFYVVTKVAPVAPKYVADTAQLDIGDRVVNVENGNKGTVVEITHSNIIGTYFTISYDKDKYSNKEWRRDWTSTYVKRSELMLLKKQPHLLAKKMEREAAHASHALKNEVFDSIFGTIEDGDDNLELQRVGIRKNVALELGYDDRNDGFSRTLFSRSKANHSRNTKQGKIKRTKAAHKQWDESLIEEDVYENAHWYDNGTVTYVTYE